MLLITDRGFHSFELWRDFLATGAALLFRAWSTITLEPTQVLSDGSYLAEISNRSSRSSATRIPLASVPNSPHLATHIPVRIIEYQIEGHTDADGQSETFRLITSILDPERASAVELAHAYHQRWEIETSFREMEIQLLGGRGLRSKTPELVRQEMWGLLISHYAIRAFMVEAADTVDLDPDRLSFTRTLNIIRRQVTDPPAFPPTAQRQNRERAITETIERKNVRRQRTYPRVAKKGNRHTFPTKKPEHRQHHYDPRPVILLPDIVQTA